MLVNMSGGKKVENIINEIVEPVLLWTNPHPTRTFGEQTLNVNTDGYDGLILEALYGTYNPDLLGQTFINNLTNNFGVLSVTPGAGKIPNTRTFTVSSNAIIFDNGRSVSGSDTKHCIPTRIWGVKYTL